MQIAGRVCQGVEVERSRSPLGEKRPTWATVGLVGTKAKSRPTSRHGVNVSVLTPRFRGRKDCGYRSQTFAENHCRITTCGCATKIKTRKELVGRNWCHPGVDVFPRIPYLQDAGIFAITFDAIKGCDHFTGHGSRCS